jgi:hypothetical protein
MKASDCYILENSSNYDVRLSFVEFADGYSFLFPQPLSSLTMIDSDTKVLGGDPFSFPHPRTHAPTHPRIHPLTLSPPSPYTHTQDGEDSRRSADFRNQKGTL